MMVPIAMKLLGSIGRTAPLSTEALKEKELVAGRLVRSALSVAKRSGIERLRKSGFQSRIGHVRAPKFTAWR